jgi:hypothetical protein
VSSPPTNERGKTIQIHIMNFPTTRRQKPRKITVISDDEDDSDIKPVVRKLNKKKVKAPTTRLSYDVGNDNDEYNNPTDSSVALPFVVKKSALSIKAMERNAARKATTANVVGMERLTMAPARETVSYSKEYLEELKRSQLAAPPTDAMVVDEAELGGLLNDNYASSSKEISISGVAQTEILDEGLVRVMKARRKERAAAVRAGAKDFISLNNSGDEEETGNSEILLRPKKKKESRLTRPDDDFFEDEEIANYVDDDEKVLLTNSKSARREQERRRKQAIRETIEEAEGMSDSGDSEVPNDCLVEDWERDQIRKGAFSHSEHGTGRSFEGELEALARCPPVLRPLPDIKDVVARLEVSLKAMEVRKRQTERHIEMLQQEKSEIREREEMVQTRLKQAGEQYEKLKVELSLQAGGELESRPEDVLMERGLESYGDTPIGTAVEQ